MSILSDLSKNYLAILAVQKALEGNEQTSNKNLWMKPEKIKKTKTDKTVTIPKQEYDELRKLVGKGLLLHLHYNNTIDHEYQELSGTDKRKTWCKFIDELNILHDIAESCEELYEELEVETE